MKPLKSALIFVVILSFISGCASFSQSPKDVFTPIDPNLDKALAQNYMKQESPGFRRKSLALRVRDTQNDSRNNPLITTVTESMAENENTTDQKEIDWTIQDMISKYVPYSFRTTKRFSSVKLLAEGASSNTDLILDINFNRPDRITTWRAIWTGFCAFSLTVIPWWHKIHLQLDAKLYAKDGSLLKSYHYEEPYTVVIELLLLAVSPFTKGYFQAQQDAYDIVLAKLYFDLLRDGFI